LDDNLPKTQIFIFLDAATHLYVVSSFCRKREFFSSRNEAKTLKNIGKQSKLHKKAQNHLKLAPNLRQNVHCPTLPKCLTQPHLCTNGLISIKKLFLRSSSRDFPKTKKNEHCPASNLVMIDNILCFNICLNVITSADGVNEMIKDFTTPSVAEI